MKILLLIYIGNYLFASGISHPRCRNSIALFVNMVLSDECKILITLYQLKRYNDGQLRTEFPDKGWIANSINRLLKKFQEPGTVDRATELHHRIVFTARSTYASVVLGIVILSVRP